jgi:ribonuclease HII
MNLNKEKSLFKEGYRCVVGLDEVGRGPLAGPVFAAAVMIKNCKFGIKNLKEVNDSKKLSPKKREEVYKLLINSPHIKWGIGSISEKIIDKINILQATKKAMIRAIKNLEKRNKKTKIDYLIIDGNFAINTKIPQESVIKGDAKIFSCAAASIIAKVTRDRLMDKYHKKYPQYGFNKHKGYPTKKHRASIKKYGPSKIHRLTFRLSI